MNKAGTILLVSFILSILTGCSDKKKSDSHESYILYVGTYTEKESHVNGKADGIYVYELDIKTGKLNYISVSPATINPSFIDVDSEGKYLYSVNETGGSDSGASGTLSAFRLTDNGKQLELVNKVSSGGNYPCYIKVDKSGKYVLTANYGSGTVALVPLKKDGSLDYYSYVDVHQGKGPDPRQEGAHAHSILNSPDNRFVYACDLGTDQIYIYRLNTLTNKLEPAENNYTTQEGAGPRHLVFHPAIPTVYLLNELNGTIECLKRDTLSGMLTRFQVIGTLGEGIITDASCADIHITPAGDYLYASNRGKYNSISIFSINRTTGEITFSGHQSVKGNTPRNFIIDPTGTYLLAANQDSDNIITFKIDHNNGNLIDIDVETQVPTPVCLKFHP